MYVLLDFHLAHVCLGRNVCNIFQFHSQLWILNVFNDADHCLHIYMYTFLLQCIKITDLNHVIINSTKEWIRTKWASYSQFHRFMSIFQKSQIFRGIFFSKYVIWMITIKNTTCTYIERSDYANNASTFWNLYLFKLHIKYTHMGQAITIQKHANI